jgi:hypothetical protein
MKTLNALINVYSLCPIQLVTILIVTIGYLNKPISKTYTHKALAFVKGIWLPMSSNYLIYSGVSPGLKGFADNTGSLAKHV